MQNNLVFCYFIIIFFLQPPVVSQKAILEYISAKILICEVNVLGA